jgi:hypothetical protein
MKIIKYIKVGSTYFFSNYEDFNLNDIDYLCIVDDFKFPNNGEIGLRQKKRHIFLCKNLTKQEFINDVVVDKHYMNAGEFLIPEFNEYINFTIDDFKSICYIFNNMDYRHTYEKIIAEAYVENNGFFLTDEQRDMAYMDYKKARNLL